MYPNPNNGKVNLLYSLITEENATLIISDVNGKVLYKNNIDNKTSKLEINFIDLSEGIYFYKIESQGKTLKTDKLVIIK